MPQRPRAISGEDASMAEQTISNLGNSDMTMGPEDPLSEEPKSRTNSYDSCWQSD